MLIFAAKRKNRRSRNVKCILDSFTTLPAASAKTQKGKSDVISPQRLHHAKTCLDFHIFAFENHFYCHFITEDDARQTTDVVEK